MQGRRHTLLDALFKKFTQHFRNLMNLPTGCRKIHNLSSNCTACCVCFSAQVVYFFTKLLVGPCCLRTVLCKVLNSGGVIGGTGGATAWGISPCIGAIKISFSVISNKEIHALRGFYHDFSTKQASSSPWPPPTDSAPWTPEVPSPL